MIEKFKNIVAAGVIAGAELTSPSAVAGAHTNEQYINKIQHNDIRSDLEAFNHARELAPLLTEQFKKELNEKGCERIDIFPGIGEDKESIVEIVFMGRSDTVEEIDPKTNKVIGPGLESVRILPILIDSKTAGNKYLLQEFLAKISAQELKED